jgi:hypothetical protein
MGNYTKVYFLPEPSSNWTPTAEFLRRLLERFGAPKIGIFSGQSTPAYWDFEEAEGFCYLFSDEQVPIDAALERWEREQPLVTHMALQSGSWSAQLGQHLWNSVPEAIRGNCYTSSPNILIGPWSVPAYDKMETEFQGTFYLSVSGEGSPNDPEQYEAAVKGAPGARDMLGWLQETTATSWDAKLHVS